VTEAKDGAGSDCVVIQEALACAPAQLPPGFRCRSEQDCTESDPV